VLKSHKITLAKAVNFSTKPKCGNFGNYRRQSDLLKIRPCRSRNGCHTRQRPGTPVVMGPCMLGGSAGLERLHQIDQTGYSKRDSRSTVCLSVQNSQGNAARSTQQNAQAQTSGVGNAWTNIVLRRRVLWQFRQGNYSTTLDSGTKAAVFSTPGHSLCALSAGEA
jgi:hypothetical protein